MSELPIETTPQSTEGAKTPKEVGFYVKWAFLSLLMLVSGWLIADALMPKTPEQSPTIPQKGGFHLTYQDQPFDVFIVPIQHHNLRLFCTDAQKVPFRDFNTLRGYLQTQNQSLLFAMNAGMYTPENLPKGLYIENKQTLVPLDTATMGFGNFYLQPNGVFAFDDTSAVILSTQEFQKQKKDFAFATQSGPLLVVNGVVNPVFTPQSTSLFIRNGVGITHDHKMIFAISNQPVNFYVFAMLFKEQFKCLNALFLDGAISKMYAADIQRFDLDGNLGPMLVLSNKM
ncbi:MAG: phosphodiester glycosidase family protein [Saprospiraceae bacterium]|nr:phosphodiester glycosidase family protein [Saprospiraceae bacterium]